MATIYRNDDADLGVLTGTTIAILGYGNQGRSQALNLRDSGARVIVGSPSDNSAKRAAEDGFEVFDLKEAAARGRVIFVLLPDEVQPEIYGESIESGLNSGDTLVFGSAYNVHYGQITPPANVNVVLLAPRMIGKGVRDTFVSGEGCPSLVAVHQDATGNAKQVLLALAKGIGSTNAGAVETTFREETVVDLFAEQSGDYQVFQAMFESLTEAGIDPDVSLLELYASGELSTIYDEARDLGLLGQMKLHSTTSQYGQQVVAARYASIPAMKDGYRQVIAAIEDGSFLTEWTKEHAAGHPRLIQAVEENKAHPMQQAEDSLYERLGRREGALQNWLAGGTAR